MASSVDSRGAAASPAICRTRLRQSAPVAQKRQTEDPSGSQDDNEKISLLEPPETELPAMDIRLKWSDSIAKSILNREGLGEECGVRDWDFVLGLDGAVENQAANEGASLLLSRQYPPRYQLPEIFSERLDSNQKRVGRAERFALGCLLYQVQSGKLPFSDLEDDEAESIQSRYLNGEFPDDVWELPYVKRILACWCPEFAKELLAAHSENKTVLSKMASYVKQHPILFGLQVTGGILSLASLVAVPILGAMGFSAAGPIAGSAAAAWQGSIGLVEAGSIFAWCQSAAMGGAAVTGIVATGLAGASVAVGSVILGTLDDIKTPPPELKEKFLEACKREVDEVKHEGNKL